MVYFISVATFAILFTLACCTIESFRIKTAVSRALGLFEIVTIIAISLCYLSYVMPSAFTARLFFSLYSLSIDFSLYALMNCVFAYDEREIESFVAKIVRYWYIGLTFLDAVFLIWTGFNGLCIDVTPYVLASGKSTWVITFNSAITFHIGLCYSVSIFLFITLIKAVKQTSSFYKSRFLLVLSLFLCEVICNFLFIIAPQFWIYDYSTLIYGTVVIICFSISMYSVPKTIKKKIVGIASESVSDAVLCFDYKAKCIFLNETAKIYYNAYNDEWVHSFLMSDSDCLIRTVNMELNGEVHTCKVEYRRFYDNKKKLLGSYIKLNDYTDEIKKIKNEEFRASHDSLTGLLNREYFFKEAQRVLSAEPLVPRYLVCTDINNFKMFNELFGAAYGDMILRTQAEMLNYANYDGAVLGRISGDKFAMLIKQRNFNPELAIKNTDKIKDITKDIEFPLTVYIGVYKITDNSENVRSMYDKAYMAIKNIPEGSNTRVTYYESALLDKAMEEKNIVSRFESALNNKQFIFYLQSQVDSKTKKCLGAEALVRWNFPERGVLPPYEYINVLEKSGLIHKLDKYIWEEVVKVLKDWKERGIKQYISINVSVKDFYYIDLYKELTSLVEKYEVSPSKLNIEITESVIAVNNHAYGEVIKKLQNYGFKIEMDDFGSGYSSLNLLKDVSMDVLKIDMGFLSKTENSDRAVLIINSITKMAKKLGMLIIAEGVETEEQTDILVKANVDLFQGYLYSKPIPVEEFEEKYLGVKK